MLEAEGAAIEFAFDGAQAVERIAQGPANIDLILCDIQMPVMDGNEATRRIARLAPGLPIIGLTAHAFSQAREEALRSGMVDYITKPYMLDTLVRAVLKHTSRPPESPMNVAPPSSSARSSASTDRPTPEADWACMQQHFAPQPGVLGALISVARQTLPGVAEQLDLALQASDLARLAKVAHEIKGIALNLRTPGLTELATRTQDQSRQADPQATEMGLLLSGHLKGFLARLISPSGQPASTTGQ
jgi:CheY-like chemotaxis protein